MVVTAPFEVSGTGALTGVFMAYEAQGNTIDGSKAAAAVEEMYETAQLQSEYGDEIAEVISDAKDQVVSATSTMSDDEIRALIRQLASDHGIDLSDSDVDRILSLLRTLESLDYDSNAFASTLSSYLGDASGILGAITNFFNSIANFFASLTGNGDILSGLNTDVFSLDQ